MTQEQLNQYQTASNEAKLDALQKNIEKYQNYLQINSHKPLQRHQFKEKFLQKEYFNQRERQDLKKLTLALAYIKELNSIKYDELTAVEKKIRERVERKTNQPQEQYKMHLSDVQDKLVNEQQKAMDAMK